MVEVIRFLLGIMESIIEGILGAGFDWAKSTLWPERKQAYDADFMSAGRILSSGNAGFCLTGSKSLSMESSFANCSVFGPSGSGKSSTVLLPSVHSLALGGSSLCINDPSGELYGKVSGYLAEAGYAIQRVDFSSPGGSEGFNPLARCATVSDIRKVVQLIIRNTMGESKGDPFWDRSSEMLISLFARYLVFHALPEYRTMANVLHLIETFATYPKKVDLLFLKANDEKLLSEYKATIAYGDKTLQSIIATARAALNCFSDPTIVLTTSVDTLDFGRFRREKVALFICNPIKDIHYYKPLSALLFESMFNEIMSAIPKKEERAVFCLLDEAVTMRFSSLSTTISNIRKYRAGIMIVVQDYQALVALYGASEAQNIRTNTYAQVYLKGQPPETCRELEAVLGRFTYADEKSGAERIRQLMTADEIRKSEEAILLCGNHPPIRTRMKPYYEHSAMRKRSEIPPYNAACPLPQDMPPMIQFDAQ